LTGPHAGAQIRLAPGAMRIGADEDADIRLTDWRGCDAILEMNNACAVAITRTGSVDDGEEPGSVWLVDWVPMQFDDVVLCVGPADIAWPSDVDLLSALLANPVKQELASIRRGQTRRRRATALATLIALGCVMVGGAVLGTVQFSKAARPGNPEERASRIRGALTQAHLSGLHVEAIGNSVVISGMVATPMDDTALRRLLMTIAPHGVERHYDVAQLDARGIEDSLGIAGIHVAYVGDGQFSITGRVASTGEVETALARVKADLSPNVKGIVVHTVQAASAARQDAQKYSEMVSSDDVEYAETPDGVKHIFAFEPASAASSAAAASAAAASANGASDGAVAPTPASGEPSSNGPIAP